RVCVAGRHVTILAGLGIRAGTEIGLILAIEPFEISHLFEGMPERFLVHHRQIDHVTVAAQARIFYVVVVLGIDTERLLHRMRRDVLVFERAKYLGGFPGGELAGDVVIQEVLKGVLAWRRMVLDYVMTGSAANAVTRERAILEVSTGEVGIVYEIEFEVWLGSFVIRRSGIIPVIGVELTLAHYSVTAKAHVDYCLLIRRSVFQVGQLAVQLRVEDRISSRKSHRRPSPFAVRRHVHRVIRVAFKNHRILLAEPRVSAVAGHARIGSRSEEHTSELQ